MNAMEIDSAFSQAQAAVDVGVAMIGAAQAYKKILELKAKEGLKQRYLMQSESVFRRKNRAFQGRYFLTPFLARGVGMGLTMVNLDTGKRADLLYFSLVIPLLAFDVNQLPFLKENRMRKVAGAVTQGTVLSEEEIQKIVAQALKAHGNFVKTPKPTATVSAFYEAVKVSNPTAVTATLDNGAKTDLKTNQNVSLLDLARQQSKKLVALINKY